MPLKLNSTGGGSVSLDAPSTASTFTLTLPAANATVATTTGTLTNPTINGFTGDTSVINVGSGQFYKDTSGNVGIGQTPTAYGAGVRNVEAYIAGASAFTLISANTASVKTEISASESSLLGQVGTRTNHPFLLKVNDAERMRIDTSGNVGIGTGSPTQKLVINDASTAAEWDGLRVLSAANPSGTSYTYINIEKGSGYGGAIAGYLQQGVGSGLAFFSNNAGTRTERMRIDSNGSIGVGTTSPAVKFHVASNNNGIAATAAAGASANLYLGGNGNTLGAGSFDLLQGSSSEAYVYQRAAQPLIFGTSNAERARITSGGEFYLGITASGTSSAKAQFYSSGAQNCLSARVGNNAYAPFAGYNASDSVVFYVTGGGVINAVSTTISGISDQRLKENVQDLDVGLDAIMALKPRKFDWKEGKGKDIKGDRGFIAQEFEQVFPDLIDQWADPAPEGEEPYKSIRQDLIPVLVKAIQEQQAQIESLTARIAQLEAK